MTSKADVERVARAICRSGGLCVGFCHATRCPSAIEQYGEAARAAIAAMPEAGWALVPIEPTRAMMDAYWAVVDDHRQDAFPSDAYPMAINVWWPMLAASPAPPSSEQQP